jgi:hypothetical protein
MVKFYAFKKIGNPSDLPNLLDVKVDNTSDVMACDIAMWWHMC